MKIYQKHCNFELTKSSHTYPVVFLSGFLVFRKKRRPKFEDSLKILKDKEELNLSLKLFQ